MLNTKHFFNLRYLQKIIGPGQLFASAAIGTSHLVLSTRAGAHYGMIFFWIILTCLILKYPFFEFSVRYTNATGHSLLKGFADQGKWAVILYLCIISVNMFAVTGAIGAVCAGILSTMFGMGNIPVPVLLGGVYLCTALLLLVGRYAALDTFIKGVSVILLVTVFTAFFAVLLKGPVERTAQLPCYTDLLAGSGLALTVSLIGFMPTGLEASVMHSIWSVEKIIVTGYRPTLRETLFDFNLGYLFTSLLAFMFLVIGAFTVYGSGQLLEGNSTQFSNKLLTIFTTNLGTWTRPVIACAAFGTIYGTLITVWDAFTRSFVRCLQVLRYRKPERNEEQQRFLNRWYNVFLVIIGAGGFILFFQFSGGMIKVLEAATISVFLSAPVIAFLNLRVILHPSIPASHRPSKALVSLAGLGLVALAAFALYYLRDILG